jgi:hypothetical protein
MPIDPAKQGAADALRKSLNEIAAYDPSGLAEGKELGAINFQKGKPLFEQAIDLAKEFRALPLDLLPIATLQQLQSPIMQVAQVLKGISAFTLVGKSNPEQQRNDLLQNAQRQYDDLFTAVTPHLAYLSLKSAQVQETMRRSAELLTETEQKVRNGMQELEQKKGEMDSIVRAARDAAAKVGVAHFATKFEEIARDHDRASLRWLVATASLGVATALVALGLLYLLPPLGELKEAATIQRIITKLVVISIFYFAAVWSAKNYRARRHLAVVNAHRQNALSTFETFVKAAADDQTKNAVLLEATRCIFSPAVTGYLSGEDEATPASRIVEILSTVSGSASK